MLKKIRVYDLQVGMYVVDTGLSWLEHPLLYAVPGHIASEEHIQSIRREGYAELFIETDKDKQRGDGVRLFDKGELERAMGQAHIESQTQAQSNKSVPLDQELQAARATHRRSLLVAREVMEAVTVGRSFDAQACKDVSRDISSSVSRNRDALICLTWLNEAGVYTARHAANVAALAAAFGDFLGLNRVQVSELALAGFLHDVGKALAPRELLDKPIAVLTPEQLHRVKFHPVESCSILSAGMDLPAHVLRGISEHHERYDGSGYPRGVGVAELSFFGQILALADAYDVLTHDTPHHKGVPSGKALGMLYAKRNKHFEARLLERFIKCLGIYVVGSFVRLSSGECAVVRESNPETPLKPKVAIIFDPDMHPIHPVLIDLATLSRPLNPLEIREALDHRLQGVNPLDHLV